MACPCHALNLLYDSSAMLSGFKKNKQELEAILKRLADNKTRGEQLKQAVEQKEKNRTVKNADLNS